jgi:hypothetical protein
MLAPYPTFNSRRLDAFLPLKAENHLLNDRLAVSARPRHLSRSIFYLQFPLQDLKRNDADDTADDSATSSDVEMLHDTRTGTPETHVAIASAASYPFHHSSISAEYARSHHHAHALKAPPPPPAHKVKLRGSTTTTLAEADDITEAGTLKRKVCALSPPLVTFTPIRAACPAQRGSRLLFPSGALADQLSPLAYTAPKRRARRTGVHRLWAQQLS